MAGLKQVFNQALTEVSASQKDNLGDIRQEGNKFYKYVRYNGGSGAVDAVVGDAVFYTGGTGYSANEVRQDVTDLTGDALPAGIVLAAIGISTFSSPPYIWIQIKGPATLSQTIESSNDGTPVVAADGDPLAYGDADGRLRRYNTTVDNDNERVAVCGYAADASAKEIICDFPF